MGFHTTAHEHPVTSFPAGHRPTTDQWLHRCATTAHSGACSALRPRYPRPPRARAPLAGGGAGRPPTPSGPRAAPGGQPLPQRAPSSGAPPRHVQARSLRCTALTLSRRLPGPARALALLAVGLGRSLLGRLLHLAVSRRRGLLGAVHCPAGE